MLTGKKTLLPNNHDILSADHSFVTKLLVRKAYFNVYKILKQDFLESNVVPAGAGRIINELNTNIHVKNDKAIGGDIVC